MGLYDREYYREERSGWSLAGQHSMVNILIAINAAVYLIELLFGGGDDRLAEGGFVDHLCVHSDLFSRPWDAWQLLTAGFAHDPNNFLHILFNMFALWMFGREVEGIYGRYEFLRLYLTLVVLTSLSWVTVEYFMNPTKPIPMLGASGAITGVIMIYRDALSETAALYLGHPADSGLGVWRLLRAVRSVWTGTNARARTSRRSPTKPTWPAPCLDFSTTKAESIWGGSFRPGGSCPAAAKPKLRVHAPSEPEETFDQRLDRILAKIAKSGIDSLSPEEQRLLEDASRRMQRRRS